MPHLLLLPCSDSPRRGQDLVSHVGPADAQMCAQSNGFPTYAKRTLPFLPLIYIPLTTSYHPSHLLTRTMSPTMVPFKSNGTPPTFFISYPFHCPHPYHLTNHTPTATAKSTPVSNVPTAHSRLGGLKYNKKHNTPRHPTSTPIPINLLIPTIRTHGIIKLKTNSSTNLRKRAVIASALRVAAEAKFVKACTTGKVFETKMDDGWKWRWGKAGDVVTGGKELREEVCG